MQALAACAVGVVIILIKGDDHFLTGGDQIYHWSIVAYIGFYLAWHERPWHFQTLKLEGTVPAQGLPVYNVIIATLQLIACRFYTAAESPYNLVLMGIVATRAW